MTLLLIIPAWLILLSLIAGLCFAARLGDSGGGAELRALERERQADSGPRKAHAKEHGSGSLIAA
jgi:hypothetical protein